MKKQVKRAKNMLCKTCKNDCKDMYKYGPSQVKTGCYFIKQEGAGANG